MGDPFQSSQTSQYKSRLYSSRLCPPEKPYSNMKIQAIAAITAIFCGLSGLEAIGLISADNWIEANREDFATAPEYWGDGHVYNPGLAGSSSSTVEQGLNSFTISTYATDRSKVQITNYGPSKAHYLIGDNSKTNRYLEGVISRGNSHLVEGSNLTIWFHLF